MMKINSQKIRYLLWGALLMTVAIVSRFLFLELKPIHSDESVNGWFVIRLWETGYFKYDPENYHGPLYFYLLQWTELILGKGLFTLRAVASFFSVLTVGTLYFFENKKYWLAALLLCVSPTMIFYGRSGIHESTFVFFQLLAILALIRYFEKYRQSDLMIAIASVVIMFTLKETVAIFLIAFVPTGFIFFRKEIILALRKLEFSVNEFFLVLLSLIVFVFSFAGFGKNWMGLIDFFRAFLPWLKTGTQTGGGHNKPFEYWFQFVFSQEPVLIVVMISSVFAYFMFKNKILRWLILSSFVQFLIYSVIPYKTPWCIISLTPGFYLISSFIFIELNKYKIPQKFSYVIISGLVLFKTNDVVLLNFKTPFLIEHPMVYVNSTSDLKFYTDRIVTYLQVHPESQLETLQLATSESWPFPWIFYGLAKLQYSKIKDFIEPGALAYIIDLQDEPTLLKKINSDDYIKVEFVLRSSGPNVQLWIKKEIASIFEDKT